MCIWLLDIEVRLNVGDKHLATQVLACILGPAHGSSVPRAWQHAFVDRQNYGDTGAAWNPASPFGKIRRTHAAGMARRSGNLSFWGTECYWECNKC